MYKKVLMIVFCLMLVSSVFAEERQHTISAGLGYSFSSESLIDNGLLLGLEYQYDFTENISAVAGYTYTGTEWDFLGTKIDIDISTLILAAKYNFQLEEKFSPYVLGGLARSSVSISAGALNINVGSEAGLYIGAGIEGTIADNIRLGVEADYNTASDIGGTTLSVKLGYQF